MRADLNDGKPCFSYINPPGEGVRYVCTSTSSQTVEHPEPVRLNADVWRTRITARRQGQTEIFDVTIDSFSAPSADPAVLETLTDAGKFVQGTGYTLGPPALVSSSESPVVSEAVAIDSVVTRTERTFSYASSGSAQTFCVGDVGDLPGPPDVLPQPPCAAGATSVPLRPLGTTSPLNDRLEDAHAHVRTDRYATLLATGDLRTAHYEVLARATPCTVQNVEYGYFQGNYFHCFSTSHNTTTHVSTASEKRNAWSTRVTGRLRGKPPLYDVTINSDHDPFGELDIAVQEALHAARQAVLAAAGPGGRVNGPSTLSSSSQQVVEKPLPGGVMNPFLEPTLLGLPPPGEPFCVGDFGDRPTPPNSLPSPPCGGGLFSATVPKDVFFVSLWDTHIHHQRDVYEVLTVTGTLTTTHYEYVGESSSSAPTLTISILLSPSGGSAFTSELTLANFAPSDTVATFAYTPAFGGTPGTVTDTLPAATQKIVPDAIAYLKGLGLNDPGAGGVLRMTFEESAAPDVYASVRTTAASSEGRVGLAYPALPPSKLFSSSVFLSGLRQSALDRSNVAVLNAGGPADGDVTLRLTVYSGDPAYPQTKVLPDVTLTPGGFSQISGVLASNGLSLSNGYVKVERIAGTAPFYAYAVVNDQATADGSFIEPIAATPAAPISSTTLPVVVETSSYSTELVLTNFSASPRTLKFTWVAPALTSGKATLSISLLPGEQQILPAFVQLLRDRGAVSDPPGPSVAGALFVSDATSDLRGVAISARILSALGNGRAGVALPSYPSGSESTAPVWLCGLQQNAETRSNLALVNVGSVDSSPSSFRIDLYDGASGAKVASPVATVPAKGFVQIDRILAVYAPGVAQGCALVTRTSGSNPFLAYAVLNDGSQPGQRSGDGAYVASRPLAP